MTTLLRAVCGVLLCATVLSCGGGSAPDPATATQTTDAPGAYRACSGLSDTGWCWLQPQAVPRQWQDFHFVDGERGWAAGEAGALIATGDGGRSWYWQLTPLKEELSLVRFADRNRGWAFARGTRTVVATQDGGLNWEVVGEIPLGHPLRFFERAVERFWVTSSGTLVASSVARGSAISEDGGRTWRVLSMPPVIDVGRSGTLWSRSLEGLWASRDGGRSASLALECRYPCYVADAVDLTDDSRLTVLTEASQTGGIVNLTRHGSSDGGRTWSAAPVGTPQASSTSVFSPLGPLVEGQVWGQSREPGFITLSPAEAPPNTLVALWHSSDEGRTWARAPLPPVELDGNSMPRPLDGRSLWIQAKEKAYFTVDAGTNWRTIQVPGETHAPMHLRRSGGVLLAAFGNYTGLRWYSSADAGESWSALPGGQADGTTPLHYAVRFADAQHGMSFGGDGIIRQTDDGGRSWVQSSTQEGNSGLASRWFYAGSHFAPDGVIWVVAGEQLQRSRDGGRTWDPAALPARIAAQVTWLQFVDAAHGWLTSSGCDDPAVASCWQTLYRTSDGGLSWESAGMLEQAAKVAFADPQIGVLMRHDASLYRTEDGGQSWTPLDIDRRSVPFAQLIYFRSPTVGWIVPATLADRRLMQTTDGGRSWTLAATLPETGTSPLDIRFADEDNGWMVGERGLVLHTRDGGASWQRQDSGTERLLLNVFPIDGDTAWITGAGGTLLFTQTGGRAQ